MRTITSQQILTGVAAKAGLDITDGGVAALQTPTILPWLENLAEYLKVVWELYPFPDIMLTEERYFYDGVWTAGTYASGVTLYHTDRYYTSNKSTSEEPSLTASDWDEATLDYAYLPFAPLNYDRVDFFDFLSDEDPRPAGFRVFEIPYTHLDAEGAYFSTEYGDSVWMRAKQFCPVFTLWEAQAYPKDSGVYSPTDGKFWKAKQTTGLTAPVAGADWEEFAIPAIFRRYLVLKVYAQWLRSRDDITQGNIASSQAEKAIDHEIEIYVRNGGQLRPVRYQQPS